VALEGASDIAHKVREVCRKRQVSPAIFSLLRETCETTEVVAREGYTGTASAQPQ
jgi:hypothetical protein